MTIFQDLRGIVSSPFDAIRQVGQGANQIESAAAGTISNVGHAVESVAGGLGSTLQYLPIMVIVGGAAFVFAQFR